MGSVGNRLREFAATALARADLAIVHRSNYEQWLKEAQPSHQRVPLPPEARDALRADHPRLLELTERYRSHPAAAASVWSDEFVSDHVDLRFFRGDNAFVWQRRANTQLVNYGITTYYLQQHDPLKLLGRLPEDNLFGAHTYEVDGLLVSRDLLDSVTELSFLEEELGVSTLSNATLLDIGSGYGRLAHRATAALDVTYLCTDGVPVSSFLCEYYLQFRQAIGAEVIPLDRISQALQARRVDIAVNVHSFSECPIKTIEWWLDLLAAHGVSLLMIIPNGEELLSTETSRERINFLPLLEARGFQLRVRRPKYAHSAIVQEHGLFPGMYYLFENRG